MRTNIEQDRLVLSVEEARKLLGLSRNSIYSGIAKSQIPSVRVGRRLLIPREALLRMLDGSSGESYGTRDQQEKGDKHGCDQASLNSSRQA